MAFKLTVFIAILIAIGVLGMRWYAAALRQFELRRVALDDESEGRELAAEAARDGARRRR